jgi:YegS C-terminal NAD kinase beta sandwich-like domain
VIRPGEPWGSPTSSSPDLEVRGSDIALARAAAGAPGALIRFVPDATSDLALAVGLRPDAAATTGHSELPMDALSVSTSHEAAPGAGTLASNLCIFGTPPDRLRWSSPSFELCIELDGRSWFSGRATTVVVAIRQFLRGLDLVPRGHPGDGKAEIQVYELTRTERRVMRARLASGSHLPHPRIRSRTAARIKVDAGRPPALEVDGEGRAPTAHAVLEVVPGAYRLLI